MFVKYLRIRIEANNMEKNIVVCTFSAANNYGAVLQCYGLINTLKSLAKNSKVEVYMDKKDIFLDDYRLVYKPASFKSAIKMLLNYPMRKKCVNKFNEFRNEFFAMTSQSSLNNCNVFLCGSDQIWNPRYIKDNSPYWGDVELPNNCVRASYAASLGVSSLNDDEKKLMTKKLKNFDYISVRENSGKELIYNLTSKPVHQNCDPVLLPEREVWLDLAKTIKKKINGKYVLIFSLDQKDFVRSTAIMYAKKNSFHYIEISLSEKNMKTLFNNKERNDVGPVEFLSLIYNAECVFTSSFHCTLFAMIFHKKFYTIPHAKTGSRMTDLLTRYHLEDRIVKKEDEELSNKAPDFFDFECKSKEDRINAINYLKEIIK